MLDESKLDLIRQYQAKTKACDSVVNAAVSLVMRDTNAGPEFLLMQRAKHDQDPWSGQMALPGGKFEEQDKTHRCTAIRETKEEVGIELRDDEYIGQLRLLVNLFRVLKQPMSALSKDDLVLLDQLERLAPPTKKPTA